MQHTFLIAALSVLNLATRFCDTRGSVWVQIKAGLAINYITHFIESRDEYVHPALRTIPFIIHKSSEHREDANLIHGVPCNR